MCQNKEKYSIARMAKVLEVSESGYYKWIAALNAPLSNKEAEDIELAEEIHKLFVGSKGSFGARKITQLLNEERSNPVNHKRVERLMSEYGWFSKTHKKYICTTDSNHSEAIAENLLDRNFVATQPNEKMVSDTTVVKTKQGSLYVAGIMDLYGRLPVGLAMSKRNNKELVMDALKDMIARGGGVPGCIIHSDRGSTYSSEDYRKLLSDYDLICSMSKKGDCWDNAPMESFWGKMKTEWLKTVYDTIEEAKRDIYEYVWDFYPRKRPHASNGYMTPIQYYEQVSI